MFLGGLRRSRADLRLASPKILLLLEAKELDSGAPATPSKAPPEALCEKLPKQVPARQHPESAALLAPG